MTRARETSDGKKLAQVTVRLSERDELRLLRLADSTGIPTATLARILVVKGLKGMSGSSLEDLFDDNQSSSDFAPLSDS